MKKKIYKKPMITITIVEMEQRSPILAGSYSAEIESSREDYGEAEEWEW